MHHNSFTLKKPGKILEITEDVFLIYPRRNILANANLYLLRGEQTAVIDAGSGRDPGAWYILKVLKSLGIKKLDYIIQTHAHMDHMGGTFALKKKTGAIVLASAKSTRIIEHYATQLKTLKYYDQFAELLPLLKGKRGFILRFIASIGWILYWGYPHDCKVDHVLKDGDVIDLGTIKLQVISTPGHSDGHLVFHDKERKLLFSGDHVPFTPAVHHEISINQFIDSINKMIELNDVKIALRGHANPVPWKYELKEYVMFRNAMKSMEEKITEALQEGPKNVTELTRRCFTRSHTIHAIAYGSIININTAWMKKYINHLLEKEKIKRVRVRGKIKYELVKN